MGSQSKLKWDRAYVPTIVMAIVAVMYLLTSIAEARIFGTHYTSWGYGAAIMIFALVLFVNYMAFAFVEGLLILISGLIVGSGAWHYVLAEHIESIFSMKSFNVHIPVMAIYFIFAVPFMLIRRKRMEMSCRQIFEVAAKPVDQAADGFTPRPYPAGKAQYSREEIMGFAKYMGKKLIAAPHLEDDRVLLAFSTGTRHFSKPDPEKTSYVSFGFDGSVSVNMARKDYEQYRSELTFDQLCQSLGELFKRFLSYYQKGEADQILNLLHDDSAKMKKYAILGISILVFGLFILGIAVYFSLMARS